MHIVKTPPFQFPRRLEACLCGSEKKFRHCCGSTAQDRDPPIGVHLIKNAISDEQCDMLVSVAANNEKKWLTVRSYDRETGDAIHIRDDQRITQGVDLSADFETVKQLVGNAWIKQVQPLIDGDIEWFEQPGLLYYTPGGHYVAHSDAEEFDYETGLWERALERDMSMLLYASSDFEGGSVHFTNFNYRYKPQKGDMIAFPSDHRYMHMAEAVTAGTRLAVVSWAAVKGGPRSFDLPPGNAITVNQ